MRKLLFGLILSALLLVSAPFAHASTDAILEWTGNYDVQADGTVDVTTQLDWDFGETGRRGIVHELVIQEPWEHDGDKDVRYEISDVNVSSPTGAPATFTQETIRDGEFSLLSIRIGDPDITLDEPRHTYVITYTLTGAMRTFDGVPELFWDLNSEGDPAIKKFNITVTGPDGGVQKARCLVGNIECDAAVKDGVATLRGASTSNDIVSIVASFPEGSVANAQPNLVDAKKGFSGDGMLGSLLAPLLGVPIVVGVLFWFSRRQSRRGTHLHWAGVTPGTMNPGGPVETTSKPIDSNAVRFTPPDAPLTEAGLALDLEYKPAHLAASLVQMAVDGSVKITSDPLTIVKADPSRINSPLANSLYHYATEQPNHFDQKKLQSMVTVARYHHTPSPEGVLNRNKQTSRSPFRLFSPVVIVLLLMLALPSLLPHIVVAGIGWIERYPGFAWAGIGLSVVLFTAVTIAIPTMLILGNRRSEYGLTPRGSAIRAQTQGFREYIATAEADQLNFEADRDIYRRYLPWAVLFGLTDRWAAIGRRLVETGRMLPHEAGALSINDLDDAFRAVRAIENQVHRAQREQDRAARKAASRRSSGSYGGGSGGFSGFSSSSRGGGGGGGSRSRSW